MPGSSDTLIHELLSAIGAGDSLDVALMKTLYQGADANLCAAHAIYQIDPAGAVTLRCGFTQQQTDLSPLATLGECGALLTRACTTAQAIKLPDDRQSADDDAFFSSLNLDRGLFVPLIVAGQQRGAVFFGASAESTHWDDIELFRELTWMLAHLLWIESNASGVNSFSTRRAQFLSNMSHEMRTPLNAVIGFADLLDQEIFGPLLPRQKTYVHHIGASGRQLLKIVNNTLDLSKIDNGHVTMDQRWTKPSSIVEGLRARVVPLAVAGGVTLTLEANPKLPELLVDPDRISQVLYNLVSNAIKFTPSGGQISLSSTVNAPYIEIAIQDTGIGISPEDATRLFSEFEQIQSPSGVKPDGTGLGLVLSRKIARLHGGDVLVASQVGVGSVFTLKLPLTPASAAVEPHRSPVEQNLIEVIERAEREARSFALLFADLTADSASLTGEWEHGVVSKLRAGDIVTRMAPDTLVLIAYDVPELAGERLVRRFGEIMREVVGVTINNPRLVWFPADGRNPSELLKQGLQRRD